MKTYKLKNTYYDCECGGVFYVDYSKDSYGVSPCIYHYQCDKCGKRKTMACQQEKREMSKFAK